MNIISASVATKLPKLYSSPTATTKKSKKGQAPVSFGIPAALPRRKFQTVDFYFEKKKKALEHRLPILTFGEILRLRLPYKVYLTQKLSEQGYTDVAQELEIILHKEELALLNYREPVTFHKLGEDEDMLKFYAEKLMLCSELVKKGKDFTAFSLRQSLAEELLLQGKKLWFAKHLYGTCIELCQNISPAELQSKCESEIKCILGYMELDNAEYSDWALKSAMIYLEQSREISRGHDWEFQSRVLVLQLKRPVCLFGLRKDYEVIHGRSMTIYGISTLLLYEALNMKASSIVFSARPSPSRLDVETAHECATQAIQMADECANATALSSAFMVLGALHLHKGELDDAVELFQKFRQNAELRQDFESVAIAHNMLGCAHLAQKDTVSALENFVCQKEIAEIRNLKDLEIDALTNIGQILFEEGHTMEAEECFACAVEYLKFVDVKVLMNHETTLDSTWVMTAITAGLNMWGRMAGHCRRAQQEDLTVVTKWKGYRRTMSPVEPEILVVAEKFGQVFPSASLRMVAISPSEVDQFLVVNKRLIDRLSDNGIPYDAHVSSSTAELVAQNRLRLQMEALRVPRTVRFENYDRGRRILYDSDLRENVKRVGFKYLQGESVFTLMSYRARDSDSDSVVAVADGDEEESGTIIIEKLSALERTSSTRSRKQAHKSVLNQRAGIQGKSAYHTAARLNKLHRATTAVKTIKTLAKMDRASLWKMSGATMIYTMNRLGDELGQSRLPLPKLSTADYDDDERSTF